MSMPTNTSTTSAENSLVESSAASTNSCGHELSSPICYANSPELREEFKEAAMQESCTPDMDKKKQVHIQQHERK